MDTGEVKGSGTIKIENKQIIAEVGGQASAVHLNGISDKFGNENYNMGMGADLKVLNGEIWITKLTFNGLKSEFILGGELNAAKVEGAFTITINDYLFTGKIAGAYGIGGKLLWESSATKIKGGINVQLGLGGGIGFEMEEKNKGI